MLLIEAIKRERVAQICYFLKAGFDVDLQDENGQTALIHCCFVRHSKKRVHIMKLLLSNEVDVNIRDKCGRSALSWISCLGLTDLFTLLVEDCNGQLDLRTVDNDGNTLLMLAVLSRKQSMIKCLLKTLSNCGLLCQVNQSNKKGISPLLAAFHQRDKACADLLMNEGCAVVSTVLHNLKQPSYTEKYVLPERGQAFYTKLRSIQRDDNDYKLKLPDEQEFLQFLYCTSEDLGHQDNTISAFVDLRPTTSKSATPDLDSSSIDMKKNKKADKHIVKFSYWTPEDIRKQGRTMTAFVYSRPASAITPTSNLNVAMVTKPNNSFENLYDIYSTQLSCSYRPGTVKILPSPPPSESGILTPPRRRSLLHRSSNLSRRSSNLSRSSATSGLALTPVPESDYDYQMRMKYSRSTRAASVQVKSIPRLSKLKRSRSSTFSQMTVNE